MNSLKRLSSLNSQRCCWLAVGLALIAGLSSPVHAAIEVTSVSPRTAQIDPQDIFTQPASGLRIVPYGVPVYLRAVAERPNAELEQMTWSFVASPESDSPVFLQEGMANTVFIPAASGEYQVRVDAVSQPSGNDFSSTLTILASGYAGVGNLDAPVQRFPECALCHQENALSWSETGHAVALEYALNGVYHENFDESCFECHTTGFHDQVGAENGGFDDALREAGLDLATLAEQANQAVALNNDDDPSNDVSYYDELPQSVRAMANVQCEMCHGPGEQHLGNPNRIAVPWGAESCAQCHDARRNDGTIYTHDSSGHSTLPASFERFPTLLQSDCARCHSSEGFLRLHVEGGAPADLDPSIEPHGVTCVACHDPHENLHEGQLRISGSVELESGITYETEGADGLCAACHQSRVTGDLEDFIRASSVGPHFGPQAEIMMGQRAWTFGEDFGDTLSVHQLILEDSCVACHQARIPEDAYTLEESILLGGHSFHVANDRGTPDPSDDLENVDNACLPCHMTIQSLDRPISSLRDYDGNGQPDGVQTEVQGLLNLIAQTLQERYPSISISEDGSMAVPETTYQNMTFTEKASFYNHSLFHLDGSLGVHNTRYTVMTLQNTYEALTNTSFGQEFPNAYTFDPTGINRWDAHRH